MVQGTDDGRFNLHSSRTVPEQSLEHMIEEERRWQHQRFEVVHNPENSAPERSSPNESISPATPQPPAVHTETQRKAEVSQHRKPEGDWQPTPFLVSQSPEPVVELHRTLGTADIAYGFEGGKAVKDHNGTYWIFTAEMQREPINSAMRVAIWRSVDNNPAGKWVRHGTIAESNQTYPMIYFSQQCNQPWCEWKNASKTALSYYAVYKCDPNDLLASPWAPVPVFDDGDDHWHVLFVSYQCDFTTLVRCGTGNIFGARSVVAGRDGIGGPYELSSRGPHGIVLGPNATATGTRWGDAGRGERFVDQMGVFSLGDGKGYAALTGMSFNVATAPSVRGPWKISPELNSLAFSTASSHYNENAIVTQITSPENKTVFGAVFDAVVHESYGFGFTYSGDGLHWGPQMGTAVEVPNGVRTPLGFLEEPDGTYTMFFTRRFPNCRYAPKMTDNSGGAIESYLSTCAHIYVGTFALRWKNRVTGEEIDSRDLLQKSGNTHSSSLPKLLLYIIAVAMLQA